MPAVEFQVELSRVSSAQLSSKVRLGSSEYSNSTQLPITRVFSECFELFGAENADRVQLLEILIILLLFLVLPAFFDGKITC